MNPEKRVDRELWRLANRRNTVRKVVIGVAFLVFIGVIIGVSI